MLNVKSRFEKSQDLLKWYDEHARVLPWRMRDGELPDPYAVWLSEIMLQQTTVTAVKPYFERFLGLWPNVEALANAPVESVMAAWAGLGYYSRARNLHLCSQQIVTDFAGKFPDNEAALLTLPGIGAYTAAAITSIAFDKRAVVVDGNVERVITRLYAIQAPMPKAKTLIKCYADDLTPQARSGDYAQAMMDLGATICIPKNPKCDLCPFSGGCLAQMQGKPEQFPVKAVKQPRPERFGAVFVAKREDGAILVRRRPAKGLLGGMLELPTTDWSSNAKAKQFEPTEALRSVSFMADWQKIGNITHIFTHFSLHLDVYAADFIDNAPIPEGAFWLEIEDLTQSALPSLFKKVLAKSADKMHLLKLE